MTPQATVEGLPPRFAAHIDLLQAFLKGRKVQFGFPEDLLPFAAHLQEPGTFYDELAAMLRTVVYREGTNIRRSDLHGILLSAVCGQTVVSDERQHAASNALKDFVESVTAPMQLLPEEDPASFTPVAEPRPEDPAPTLASTREYPILTATPAGPEFTQVELATAAPVTQDASSSLPNSAPAPADFSAGQAPAFSYGPGPGGEAIPEPDPHLAAEFPDAHQPRLNAYLPPEPTPVRPVLEEHAPARPAAAPRARAATDWVPALLVVCALAIALFVGLYVHHRSAARTVAAERASLDAARRETPPPQPSFGPGPVAVPAAPVVTPEPAAAPAAPPAASPAVAAEYPSEHISPEPDVSSNRRRHARERAREAREATRAGRPARTLSSDAPTSSVQGSSVSTATVARSTPIAVPTSAPAAPSTPSTTRAAAAPSEPTNADYDLQGTAKGFFAVSSGIMSDHLLSAPLPAYPKLATVTHVEGEVIVQAVVGRDGSVVATRVLRGPRLLRGAAQHAVQTWKYRPYFVNGKPTEVATIATVSFRLEDKAVPHP